MIRLKSIFNILGCLVCLFISVPTINAQKIISVEYFIDKDPGLGKGTQVTLSDSDTSFIKEEVDVSLKGVKSGIHMLSVRVKDELGYWSFINSAVFYLDNELPTKEGTSNIKRVEYFIDTDPGRGKGIVIGENLNQLSFSKTISKDVASLSEGWHSVNVRAQDRKGVWTQLNSFSLYVPKKESLPIEPTRVPSEVKIKIPNYYDSLTLQLVEGADGIYAVSDSIYLDSLNKDIVVGRYQFNTQVVTNDSLNGQWAESFFDICHVDGVIVHPFPISISGQTVTVRDSSLYGQNSIWRMGDGFVYRDLKELTHEYREGGTYEICYKVFNACDTTERCHTISIDAPILDTPFTAVSVTEDDPKFFVTHDYKSHFSDPLGRDMTFELKLVGSNVDSTASSLGTGKLEESNDSLYITLSKDFDRSFFLQVKAKAGDEYTNGYLRVGVTPVNDAPFINNISISANEDLGVFTAIRNLRSVGGDVDDSFTTLKWTFKSSVPEVRVKEIIKSVVSGYDSAVILAVDDDYFGISTLDVTLSDREYTVAKSLPVEIINVPDEVFLSKRIPDVTILEDQGKIKIVENLRTHFNDVDKGAVLYSVNSSGGNLEFEIDDNKSLFVTTPKDTAGVFPVFVQAESGSFLPVRDTFNLIVTEVNDPPVNLKSLGQLPLCYDEDFVFLISAYFSDVETKTTDMNFELSFLEASSKTLPAPEVEFVIEESGRTTLKNKTLFGGVYKFQLSATDEKNISVFDTFSIVMPSAFYSYEEGTLVSEKSDNNRYQWYKNGERLGGEVDQELKISDVENYTVEIEKDGCTIRAVPLLLTGIDDDQSFLTEEIKVFPNPVQYKLYVQVPKNTFVQRVTLFDMQGREVPTKWDKSFDGIDMSEVPKGVYTLLIESKGELYTCKVSKQ